jgi:peptidoglycan/LPS O-acetylase OafA/YrhL
MTIKVVKMNKNVSIYLDLARFMAAFAVFLCHLDECWVRGLLPFATHLGLAGVGVFFVLSGFVIGYVTDGKETDAKTYAINRAARVYSVTIPCLALTILIDLAGRQFLSDYYNASWPPLQSEAREFLQAVFSLSFLNQVWIFSITPGSNSPFWSLCYEVAYYIIFGLAFFTQGPLRLVLPVVACFCFGPRVIALLPLWFLGLGCYRFCNKFDLSVVLGRVILGLSFCFWLGCELLRWRFNVGLTTPSGTMGDDWQFYAAGFPFAASIIGFRFAAFRLNFLCKPARYLSGATFTIYLLHYPLARFINGVLPTTLTSVDRWFFIVVITIIISFIVARFTERRKNDWRDAIEKALQWVQSHLLPTAVGNSAL